jgi:predicted Zn-dependent peptidase
MTLYSPAIITLPNELQLIAVDRPYGKVFAMALAIRAGSFDDPPGLPGMAHFCEHVAFRGPNQELFETLHRLGADVNAMTASDYTLFKVRGHIQHFELGLRFIAKVLQCAPRTVDDVAAEQDIFRHELEDDEPTDRGDALDRFRRAALGDPNWWVRHDEHVSKIKRLASDVVNPFLQAHYQPANARLAVVAPIGIETVRRSLEELVRRPRVTEPTRVAVQIDKPPAPRGKRFLHFVTRTGAGRTRSSPHRLTTSFEPFGYVWINFLYVVDRTDTVARIAAEAISNRLGDGPHSELFRRVRMDEKLAYSVYAKDWPHLRRTAANVFTSVSRRSVKHALRILLECESEFESCPFSAEDLEMIKQRMILHKEIHLDYPGHLAAHLAYEALRPPAEALLCPNDHLRRISNLTLDEVTTPPEPSSPRPTASLSLAAASAHLCAATSAANFA